MPLPPCLPSRRDLLRAGALGAAGLTLPRLLRAREAGSHRATADACILLFLWGAPSQFETWDPKPDAPDGIRGEFGVRRTRLPGVLFGEHVPLLAERNDRFSVLRTCAQTSTHHQSAAYEALTGYPPSHDAVAVLKDPLAPDFNVAELSLPADVTAARLDDRDALLRRVDGQARALAQSAEARALSVYQERAVQLLTSPLVRQAFDLGREPA